MKQAKKVVKKITKQQNQEALEAYDKAIELDPNYVQAYNNKGAALVGLGRYREALEAYDKAIELDPNNVQAYVNKGKVLINLKREDEKVLRIFADFLKKSTTIMEDAIKETREKHPNLFKSP
jgi:tetratricopeptide (TPR) repeat protein